MVWLTDAEYVRDYVVRMRFNDGLTKTIDLKEKIFNDHRDIFKALRDIKLFRQFRFNPESDTIEWPNGADLAPEFLYHYETAQI